jgi:hypothetical protein
MVCSWGVLAAEVRVETPNVRSNCCACAVLPNRKNRQKDATNNDSFFKLLSNA